MKPTSLLCIQILVFDLVQLAVCNVVSSENYFVLTGAELKDIIQ